MGQLGYINTYQETVGQEYWVAVFVFVFNQSTISITDEVRAWCNATFGPDGHRWKDTIQYGEVKFKHKRDLTLFLLRWT